MKNGGRHEGANHLSGRFALAGVESLLDGRGLGGGNWRPVHPPETDFSHGA